MNQIGRRFGLSELPSSGISCNKEGVLVGAVPLLERSAGPGGHDRWQPRLLADINRDLSKRYGLPIEFDRKIHGLKAIARGLSRGDLIHAQIATVHLQIPDPPQLKKSAPNPIGIVDVARRLLASGLLRADWDPAKHPRWPAGSPEGIGGEFAPAGAASGPETEGAPVIPVQLTIPMPFELPDAIPFPSEIVAPPVIPGVSPRSSLRNPFPDRSGCEEEWERALQLCEALLRSRQMGRDGRRGFGRSFQQCVLGMVSERCGGSLRS